MRTEVDDEQAAIGGSCYLWLSRAISGRDNVRVFVTQPRSHLGFDPAIPCVTGELGHSQGAGCRHIFERN